MDSLTEYFENIDVKGNNVDILTNKINNFNVNKDIIIESRTKTALDIYNNAINMSENYNLYEEIECIIFIQETKNLFINWYNYLFYKNWNENNYYSYTDMQCINKIKNGFEQIISIENNNNNIFLCLNIIITTLSNLFFLNNITI
tara:strand:+ start:403 stop:837 length:435 start_codon:yes stop_codon:yes gene_type:complete